MTPRRPVTRSPARRSPAFFAVRRPVVFAAAAFILAGGGASSQAQQAAEPAHKAANHAPPPHAAGKATAAQPAAATPAPPHKPAAPAAPAKPGPPVLKPKGTPAKHVPKGRPAAAPPAAAPAPAAPSADQAPPAGPAKGSATGLPLPRFAAMRSDEVNLRSGPGTRYPIEWVYKRRDLPVEIEREFEVWRLVKDQEGVKGWVHQATLTGRRSFVVSGGDATIRRSADDKAAPVAVLKPGVVGRVRNCQAGADWCEVQVGEYRGFLKRSEFWGSYPGEAVNP